MATRWESATWTQLPPCNYKSAFSEHFLIFTFKEKKNLSPLIFLSTNPFPGAFLGCEVQVPGSRAVMFAAVQKLPKNMTWGKASWVRRGNDWQEGTAEKSKYVHKDKADKKEREEKRRAGAAMKVAISP